MKRKITIGLDVDGGDHGHSATVPAAIKAIKSNSNLHIKLFGNETLIKKYLKRSIPLKQLEIIPADETISNNDSPISAMRKKKSSMHLGFDYLKTQQIESFVSSGLTAILVILSSKLKMQSVSKIGIAVPMPKSNGFSYVADCGANLLSNAENLTDYARIGSIFARCAMGKTNIQVGLLNVGEEQGKGTPLIQETHEKLSSISSIDYKGFIEPYDIYEKNIDLIVCNGFEGNILIKTAQATFKFMFHLSKRSPITKISQPYWLYLNYLRKKHWTKGGYVLGAEGNIIKTHGNSSLHSVYRGIEYAKNFAEENLSQKIEEHLSKERM